MIKRLALFILVLAVMAPASGDETFASTQLGCSITYPEGWVRKRANFAPLVVLYEENVLEPLAENFHLDVTQLSGNIDQSMFSRMDLMELEDRFPEMKLVVSKDMPLGNLKDAHRFEFAGKYGGRDFKAVSVTGYKGSRKYTVYFGAEKKTYDRLISKVESSIRSFKATGK